MRHQSLTRTSQNPRLALLCIKSKVSPTLYMEFSSLLLGIFLLLSSSLPVPHSWNPPGDKPGFVFSSLNGLLPDPTCEFCCHCSSPLHTKKCFLKSFVYQQLYLPSHPILSGNHSGHGSPVPGYQVTRNLHVVKSTGPFSRGQFSVTVLFCLSIASSLNRQFCLWRMMSFELSSEFYVWET